jgi:DNA-directed RNA polymerase sigma subunit (sigma70/sigma32)
MPPGESGRRSRSVGSLGGSPGDARELRLPSRKRRIVDRRRALDGVAQRIVELAEELELSRRRTQTLAANALHEVRALLGAAEVTP